MSKINNLLVNSSLTIRNALKRLDETGETVLLLVDDNEHFLRTITDGDLRRLILQGNGLEDTLALLPSLTSKSVGAEVDATTALALMNQYLIDQLPVLNSDGQPIDIYLRRDLDAKILLSTPHLGDQEMEFVQEAFRTNWIAPLGPNVDAFERELAEYVGVAHAAALSSGTAALHLALRLLGVGAGDTVFCSTLTFVASVNPILYQGATPVFIDSEPESWNMSPSALERALDDAYRAGKPPKAVMVVNLYGQSADFDRIIALCDRYGVPIVEDAAESLGATYKGKASGTFGKVGVFSFNGNKIITTSGGGMLVSNDKDLIEKARFLSTQARDPAPWYQHSEMGYNYRMSNILAGVGRGQLRVLNERVASRRKVFEHYKAGLSDLVAIEWMPELSTGTSTRWLTVCTLDPTKTHVSSTTLMDSLARSGIEARPVWKPMHLQPLFASYPYYPHSTSIDFSEKAFAHGVCLPSGSNMQSGQIDRVITNIRATLNN